MFGSTSPSIADIAAVTGNGSNGNGWGGYGDGWWALIILFALFGGWGRGGAFGGSGCGSDGSCATVGDIQRGFDNQGVTNKLNGLENGLCSLGYDQLNQMNGIQQAINNASVAQMQQANAIQSQLADCCCENRQAIAQVRYDMSTDTCAIQNQINQCCCDLKETMNSNTRAITDQLTAFRMEDKDTQIRNLESQVQALNLAASQQNQNRYLIDTLRPCPIPSYQTCNPWGGNGYGGYSYGSCCNAQACC